MPHARGWSVPKVISLMGTAPQALRARVTCLSLHRDCDAGQFDKSDVRLNAGRPSWSLYYCPFASFVLSSSASLPLCKTPQSIPRHPSSTAYIVSKVGGLVGACVMHWSLRTHFKTLEFKLPHTPSLYRNGFRTDFFSRRRYFSSRRRWIRVSYLR